MDGGHLIVHNSYRFLLIVRKINHVMLNLRCDLNANGREWDRWSQRDYFILWIPFVHCCCFFILLIEMAILAYDVFSLMHALASSIIQTLYFPYFFLLPSFSVCVWGVFFSLRLFVCFSSLHCAHSHKWRASFLSIGADFSSLVSVVVVISCVNPKNMSNKPATVDYVTSFKHQYFLSYVISSRWSCVCLLAFFITLKSIDFIFRCDECVCNTPQA